MHKIHGVAAAAITAAMLIAATGCTGSSTTTAGAPTHSATGTATTSAAAPSTTAATGGTTQAPTTQASTTGGDASPTATEDTSAPFPGIWDITSWQQYRTFQAAEMQGHQPWLLDPAMVVAAWAGVPDAQVHQIGPDTFRVVKSGVGYTVRGTRPDPSGPAAIWVITSITRD